jgi:sec1 family domain-containing protein 1
MLRAAQTERLRKALCSEKFSWKVLLLDKMGQEVIAPIFRMNDLRDMGIALCMDVQESRTAVPGASAVYVVEETRENVDAIKRDIAGKLYGSYRINFTGSISRDLFENLAVAVGKSGQGEKVTEVHDLFVSLSVLQESLFTLNIKNSYRRSMENLDRIVDGLLSLLVTLDEVPILCGRHEDKDALGVAEALKKRMRAVGRTKQTRRGKRALLIILDRSFDMIRPVEHVWTYNALINDLLEFDLNKVVIPEEKREKGQVENMGEGAVFDLSKADLFWEENQNEYFPTVAEKIERELDAYRAELAVKSIDTKSSRETIEAALSKLPELSAKNRVIYTHMSISLSIIEQIKKEFLDEFFSFEHESKSLGPIRDEVCELVSKATKENVLRMAIVLLHKFPGEREFVLSLAKKKGCSLDLIQKFDGCAQEERGSFTVASAAGTLFRNIKSILPLSTRTPIATLVENAVKRKCDGLFKIDPAEQSAPDPGISRVVVFSLGGGTFTELKALLEMNVGMEIIYGATEMVSAKSFLSQLQK